MQVKRRNGSRKTGKPGRKDPNHVPVHVANSFESELDCLIGDLSVDSGFKGRYLLSEYKSKYLDTRIVSPKQRRSSAIEKWLKTERANARTNVRIQLRLGGDFGWTSVETLLADAKKIISDVLGPCDSLCLSSHTFGASTRVRRGPSAAFQKHTGIAHVSSSAVTHWREMVSDTLLNDQEICIQESSVLFTVPKKTDIDRVACKEPEINMFLQRSVGSHIRKRLRRFGIDLNDQTRNQELARTALKQKLATLDLSAASDSITTQLVLELLPFEWYSLLDDLRVKSTIIDGEVHSLEMFSSMGNGFTFELESLIFWALTRAICKRSGIKGRISVYGDDIIAPQTAARRIARCFGWFGFKVNPKKSHWSGFFRESCGKHFHAGLDVTPFYVREPVKTMNHIIRLLNRLCEWDGRGFGFITDPRVLHFWLKWRAHVPSSLWGGTDLDDPSALVTGDSPRMRLVPEQVPIDYTYKGRYIGPIDEDQYNRGALLYWFTVRDQQDDPVECDAKRDGRWQTTRQPFWAVRTTWRPDLIRS